MKISFGNMTVELNIFDISKRPRECDEIGSACLIEEIIEEESSTKDPPGGMLCSVRRGS
jgi:hypothetical protein